MIRVNLLATRAGATPKRDWLPKDQRSALLGLGLLVVTAAGVGLWWLQITRERAAVETRISSAEAELSRLKNVAKLVDRATARKAELGERLALIDRLRAAKRGPVDLLETVSRSVTDGLWLIDLTQKGSFVQIEGQATSLTAVTDFVELMQNSGLFKRPVEIVTTSNEVVQEVPVVHFNVKAEAAATTVPTSDSAPAPAQKTNVSAGQAPGA